MGARGVGFPLVMDEEQHVREGVRVQVRLADGRLAEGEVIDIGGRLLGADGTDPGWARVRLADGAVVAVAEAAIVDVVDSLPTDAP